MTAIQLGLLDVPVDVAAPVSGGVRRTDPVTSLISARGSKELCAVRRQKLLAAFASVGPEGLTDEAAGIRANVERVEDTRRCNELRRNGLIVFTGKHGVTSKDRPARKYAITVAGRAALASLKAAQ